jgi:hypothetical protein
MHANGEQQHDDLEENINRVSVAEHVCFAFDTNMTKTEARAASCGQNGSTVEIKGGKFIRGPCDSWLTPGPNVYYFFIEVMGLPWNLQSPSKARLRFRRPSAIISI